MKITQIRTGLLIIIGALFCTATAGAEVISEIEPNNDFANAQHIDVSSFTVGLDSDITNSDIWPWVSIIGTGDGTFDYYSFEVSLAGTTASIDIDYNTFDTVVLLYDADGNLLAENDDNWSDPGSNSWASLIEYTSLPPGTYIVAVAKISPFGEPVGVSGGYGVHISLSQVGVSLPPDTPGQDTPAIDITDQIIMPMEATGQIIIKPFKYDRDRASFHLRDMEGIDIALLDAMANGTGLSFSSATIADSPIYSFSADSNELDADAQSLVYNDGVNSLHCRFNEQGCVVQISRANLSAEAVEELFTEEMTVRLALGENLYLNTSMWEKVESKGTPVLKYQKKN
ncbi:MAG: DVUA0089 family protein [Candidatus Electrothrix sp. GW3-4]|uniref:DVUA0089 family protein n=1 Tax=Candidatus Electrothrix sp. GW3-4 TaxID=3126740 RepID=UPI0030D0590C